MRHTGTTPKDGHILIDGTTEERSVSAAAVHVTGEPQMNGWNYRPIQRDGCSSS